MLAMRRSFIGSGDGLAALPGGLGWSRQRCVGGAAGHRLFLEAFQHLLRQAERNVLLLDHGCAHDTTPPGDGQPPRSHVGDAAVGIA